MPDFASIKTLAEAQASARAGDLVKVFLLPTEFGGKDVPQNVVYLPLCAQQEKVAADLEMLSLIQSSGAHNISIVPEYREEGFIPYRITMRAALADVTSYLRVIDVW